MVIVGQITQEMEVNIVGIFPLQPTTKTGGVLTLGTACSGCELTMLGSLAAWMVWVSALGRRGSTCGLGSHGRGSGVSEGNLHHASQPPDELWTSGCKERINEMLDSSSHEHATLPSQLSPSRQPINFLRCFWSFIHGERRRDNETEGLSRDPTGALSWLLRARRCWFLFELWVALPSPGVSFPVFEQEGWRAPLLLVLLAPPAWSFLSAFNLNGLTS